MAVYFGSFLIRGVVGVGNLALIIILGTLILGPHHAVVLAVTTTTVSQIQIVRPALRDGDWKIARARRPGLLRRRRRGRLGVRPPRRRLVDLGLRHFAGFGAGGRT